MKPTMAMLRRFCSDYQIPAPIVEPQYIQYYIDLFDFLFDSRKAYRSFLRLCHRFDTEDEFFQYTSKLMEDVIAKVKSNPVYEDFIKNDEFNSVKKQVSKHNVYVEDNLGKLMLSIDMMKANYQALKYHSSELVMNTSTFEEYISQFLDDDPENEYFMHAKKFRQVIFGNINPRRQQKIQMHIMNQVLEKMKELGFTNDDVCGYTSDELVFIVNDSDGFDTNKVQSKLSDMNVDFHINLFTMDMVSAYNVDLSGNEKKLDNYFIKNNLDGSVEFKGVPKFYMAQMAKHYLNKELEEPDLLFHTDDGSIARFFNSLRFVDYNKASH